MIVDLNYAVNDHPDALIQHRVAAAFAFRDAVRSAYLDRCCREDFRNEVDVEKRAAALVKQAATREANKIRRAEMAAKWRQR